MVNIPSPTRQVSILKICSLGLLLAGCQSQNVPLPVAPVPATAGTKTHSIQPIRRKTVVISPSPITPSVELFPTTEAVPVVAPTSASIIRQTVSQPLPTVKNTAPQSLELPNSLPNWRIIPQSSRQWRIIPAARPSLSDAPPSLMEDAIITSGIHTRLQSIASFRATNWKYSSNAGKVLLASPELTPGQAMAALRAITTLDKVTEIRLTTTLR